MSKRKLILGKRRGPRNNMSGDRGQLWSKYTKAFKCEIKLIACPIYIHEKNQIPPNRW